MLLWKSENLSPPDTQYPVPFSSLASLTLRPVFYFSFYLVPVHEAVGSNR